MGKYTGFASPGRSSGFKFQHGQGVQHDRFCFLGPVPCRNEIVLFTPISTRIPPDMSAGFSVVFTFDWLKCYLLHLIN